MSYQVIARKFRPKSFAEFVGQSHITQTLRNALASERFPHALLLTGPRGTGKTTTARIIAKTLLCEKPVDLNPCGVCQACIDVSAGSHLDVMEIDGASHNGVDHIRELRDGIGYMPSSGRYKIYIIDEVHMLSTSAFNALLKTLEEPPEHVIFIFATTEVQKIPATILSRCQRFDFRNHSLADIRNHLQNICDKENVAFEDEALWTIAKQARGSIRDSLTLLEQLVSHGNGNIQQAQVMALLGLNDRKWLYRLLRAIGEQNANEVLAIVTLVRDSGGDPHIFCEEFLEVLRNCLLIQWSTAESSLLTMSEGERQELEQIAPLFRPEELHLLFDVTLSGLQRLAYGTDPSLALEMLLLKLLHLPKLTQGIAASETPQQVVTQKAPAEPTTQAPAPQPKISSQQPTAQQAPAANLNQRLAQAPQKPSAPALSNTAQQHATQAKPDLPQTPVEPVGRTWPELVRAIKQSNGFLGALLEHTFIVQQGEGKILLGLPEKMSFLLDKLRETKNLERTQNFLQNFWREDLKVEIELVSAKQANDNLSPKAIEEKSRQQKAQSEAEKIQSHPLVRATEDVFKDQISKVGVVDVKTPTQQERNI